MTLRGGRRLLWITALAASACVARPIDQQVILYPEAATLERAEPAGPDCPVMELEAEDPRVASCQDFGDLFIGDSGLSQDCGRYTVRQKIRSLACVYGADAFVVRRVSNSWSGCYQVRTRLLVCPDTVRGVSRGPR